MKHPKNNECRVCGKPSVKPICPFCQSNHCPVPEHHVAAERRCIRCHVTFDSTWAGDRICRDCRHEESEAARKGFGMNDQEDYSLVRPAA